MSLKFLGAQKTTQPYIQEKKRQDKSKQIRDGTWKQKVTHPHRGSQRGMDGFAMEIAIGKSQFLKRVF